MARRGQTWQTPGIAVGAGLTAAGLIPWEVSSAHTLEGAGLDAYQVTVIFLSAALGFLLVLKIREKKPAPYAYLYRVKGSRLNKFDITSEVSRIGRHPNNEIRINDKSISRFHAELVRHHNGTFSIYDTKSKNGVKVGYRPVNSSVLRDGDLVDIGDVRFKFTRFPRDYNVHRNTDMLGTSPGRFETRRRHEVRESLSAHVRLYNDDTGWISGRMRNVGRDGAFVETEAKLETRLPVDMVVAVAEGDRRKWVHLAGEVAWSDERGVGVTFTDRDPANLNQLISSTSQSSGSATIH